MAADRMYSLIQINPNSNSEEIVVTIQDNASIYNCSLNQVQNFAQGVLQNNREGVLVLSNANLILKDNAKNYGCTVNMPVGGETIFDKQLGEAVYFKNDTTLSIKNNAYIDGYAFVNSNVYPFISIENFLMKKKFLNLSSLKDE